MKKKNNENCIWYVSHVCCGITIAFLYDQKVGGCMKIFMGKKFKNNNKMIIIIIAVTKLNGDNSSC